MAEVVHTADASSNELLVMDRQDCAHSERNDSVVGPLPTEGYCIYDERPTIEHATIEPVSLKLPLPF